MWYLQGAGVEVRKADMLFHPPATRTRTYELGLEFMDKCFGNIVGLNYSRQSWEK